jgi:uncharacterized protein YcgL (UPF0745 family)
MTSLLITIILCSIGRASEKVGEYLVVKKKIFIFLAKML